MPSEKEKLVIPKSESWKMFDEISPRYDLLNHFLSFGLHILWRNRLAQLLTVKKKQTVLDLATGTADVLLSLFKNNSNIVKGYGVDLAEKMLDIGREKIDKQGLSNKINLKHGDAMKIPFESSTFDATTISFGIRNVTNPSKVLNEMHRVLNDGGRTLILEFSLPKNSLIRFGHIFYLRTMVPLIGWILTRHYKAYKYLNQTIEKFPYGDAFCQLMMNAGFKNVKANPLLFGVATIYQGDKKD